MIVMKNQHDESVFLLSESLFFEPDFYTTSAWLEHIPFAFWLIEKFQPKKVVELGTHYGDSFFVFCSAVKRLELPTKLLAIDTWSGDAHAGIFTE